MLKLFGASVRLGTGCKMETILSKGADHFLMFHIETFACLPSPMCTLFVSLCMLLGRRTNASKAAHNPLSPQGAGPKPVAGKALLARGVAPEVQQQGRVLVSQSKTEVGHRWAECWRIGQSQPHVSSTGSVGGGRHTATASPGEGEHGEAGWIYFTRHRWAGGPCTMTTGELECMRALVRPIQGS